MTHLHFDCYSGISGDMVLGALVDAGLPFRNLVHGLKGLPVKGYVLADVSTETIRKAGPRGEEVFRLALARSA